jgi:CheY-like chemotaxis protein/HPt (histidine-containing phosphotransfer) domain-containing protein
VSNVNSATSSTAASPGSAISVLLVDDQKFIGMAVTRLLGSEPDIHLHCCYSAADAIAQANHVMPDVIFQDLQMPEIDGLTLVGLYRSNPATAATPIVVLSGNDDTASRASAQAAGADDYLVKLPNKGVLLECIRRYARAQEPASSQGPEPPSSRTSERPIARVSTSEEADVSLDASIIAGIRESFASGGPDLVAKLIDQFVKEASLLVARITRAAATGDGQALKAAGHSLKGTSLTIGAKRLAALAGMVESHATTQPSVPVEPTIVKALGEELERVRAACAKEKNVVVGVARS